MNDLLVHWPPEELDERRGAFRTRVRCHDGENVAGLGTTPYRVGGRLSIEF
jgi:hypothetical protein